jgi:hypothetical protein
MKNKWLALFFIMAAGYLASAQTVYVTKTGTKYHKKDCFHLKESKKAVEYAQAVSASYLPCKHCKPVGFKTASSIKTTNVIAPAKKATATQCTGKTKSGNRCKRKTKSADGRCHQH